MDPKFSAFVLKQLRELVSDLESAREPENKAFHESVLKSLRQDYYAWRRKHEVA